MIKGIIGKRRNNNIKSNKIVCVKSKKTISNKEWRE
jgi:hypothetical protein